MTNVNTEYGYAPYPAGETVSTLGALQERSRMVSSMECSMGAAQSSTQHRTLDFASRIQHSRTASSLMQKSYVIVLRVRHGRSPSRGAKATQHYSNSIQTILFKIPNMTRVTRGFVAKKRRKRVLKLAKGFRGANSVLFRTAQQRTLRALSLAYRDRRLYKRTIRGLWIRRLNSFLHDSFSQGTDLTRFRTTSYSSFIHKLKKSNILLNRKVLSQLAIFDPGALNQLIQKF